MEKSFHIVNFYSRRNYIETSNSSLTIYNTAEINCTSGNPVIAYIPVIYSVKNDTPSADVYVQVWYS